LKDNKGKAGIYQWKHLESGKFYIGSAVDLSNRLRKYYSINYLERNNFMYICNALQSHGYSVFSLSIIEYVDTTNLSKTKSRKLILEREQLYLDNLAPIYNIQNIAAGSSLGQKRSERTKNLMSEAKIGENNPMFSRMG